MGRKWAPTALLFVALFFFMWMFVASKGLERTAARDGRSEVAVAAEEYGYLWRHGMIGGWPLFRHLAEYAPLASNNRLHLVELPDRLLQLFEDLSDLENKAMAAWPAPSRRR